MKVAVFAATLLAAASPQAHAQGAKPYKLIVTRGGDGIAITDYPNAARCEAARASIQRLIARENEGKQPQHLPGGGMIIPKILRMEAYCIPG